MAIPSLDRLQATLLTSGLQIKDQPLYQVISQIISALQQVANAQSGTGGSGGGGSVVNNITNQNFALSFGDNEGGNDPMVIPGPAGADGSGSGEMVPYYVAPAEVFTVPIYKQALFGMNIDNEGILDIEGFLIEVDRDGECCTPSQMMLFQEEYNDYTQLMAQNVPTPAIAFSSGSELAGDPVNLVWTNANKRLGIRIALPEASLHARNAGAVLVVDRIQNTANTNNITARKARGASIDTPTQVLNGDGIGGFSAIGYNSAAAFGGNAGSLEFVALEDFTNIANGAKLSFRVCPIGSITNTLQMEISNTALTLGPCVSPALTGKRYLVIDTAGVVTSQNTAPVGT